MDDVRWQHRLRIKGIPGVLSEDEVRSLLKHYGATQIRVLTRQPRNASKTPAQAAIAEFPSPMSQLDAQRRLHGMELAGFILVAEIVDEPFKGSIQPGMPCPPPPVFRPSLRPPLRPPFIRPLYPPSPRAPVPIAPHLNLHYAPSPLLQYKYPKATVPIVRNIANALIALPRFYTQVLHLMNKMNLPPPFQEGIIPGVFHATNQLKRQRASVEEEEEDDDDEQDLVQQAMTVKVQTSSVIPPKRTLTSRKRPRPLESSNLVDLFDLSKSLPSRPSTVRPGVISHTQLERQRLTHQELTCDPWFMSYGERCTTVPSKTLLIKNLAESVDVKDLEYIFGYVVPPSIDLDTALKIQILPGGLNEVVPVEAKITFMTIEMAQTALETLYGVVLDGKPLWMEFCSDTIQWKWTGMALDDARLDPIDLNKDKAMKNYSCGTPTRAVYIKNLHKTTNEEELRALAFAATEGHDMSELRIQHFTQGRMKNQAFLECSTIEMAQELVNKLHGVMVHGKPMIVCFRKCH